MLKKIIQNKKIILAFLLFAIIASSGFWYFFKKPKLTELEKQGEVGDFILDNDFSQKPIIPIKQNENNYQLADSLINGPTIQYANPPEEEKDKPKKELGIEFPKNYQEPIHIKLDEMRFITIKDNNGDNYNSKLITEEIPLIMEHGAQNMEQENPGNMEHETWNMEQENQEDMGQGISGIENESQNIEQKSIQNVAYLKYQSKDKRKSTYYAYQKDNSERTLKHWTIYDKPKKDQTEEQESYTLSNVKLKLNDRGEIEVYYFGEQQVQNEQVKAEVDSDLMARAQRTLQKELGEDILNTDNHTPDLIIPAPYYINKNQERKTLNWEIDQETNTLKTNFKPEKDEYPIGLDPTIMFTAPGQDSSGDTITLEPTNSKIGGAMVSGDFNDDGRVDLAVSSEYYNSFTGRVYIFYNDGSIPNSPATADVIITGEGMNMDDNFGDSLIVGDFDGDNKDDLAVGATKYPEYNETGCVYVFYGGSFQASMKANLADEKIIGQNYGDRFGHSLVVGDFNNDTVDDLAVGADWFSDYSEAGRVYIFYGDGVMPRYAHEADIKIDSEEDYGNFFGCSMSSGDFNYDGKADLAVGALGYPSYDRNGRVYIFYNDGSIPSNASGADVIIDGEAVYNIYFGSDMTSGDFNYDGRTDLAVSSIGYSTNTGRVYIFYNDGSIPTTTATADVIITGQATTNYFGSALTSGDFNADGKIDLAVGAYGYSSYTGRTYIFYNDGNIPTTAATADVIITGQATDNYFSSSIISGDFNYDGRVDLAMSASGYSVGTSRIYIFNNDGSIPTTAATADVIITGETYDKYFGNSMTTGDLNNDGKADLIVGSRETFIYIFYSDGVIPNTALGADLKIQGDATNGQIASLVTGDFNADGKTDLAAGFNLYSNLTGRVHIFYNDGSIPTTAATADVIIAGQGTYNFFGSALVSEDFNADGRTDLAVGAYGYSSSMGRVYIFYNDDTIPTTAATADVIITGQASNNAFGWLISSGDFNSDGKIDLVVSASNYSSYTGRAYIFYNDGTIPTTAATADVIITGEATSNYFGIAMTSGDFNADGKTDLAMGAYGYSSYTGCTYIFYNDGNIPTAAATADLKITGEINSDYFGISMTSGDFNADGRIDLVVGNKIGNAYIFYNDGLISNLASDADVIITMNIGYSDFSAMTVGDLNADGRDDLIVGDKYYKHGKVFIFYNNNGQIAVNNNAFNDQNYRFGADSISSLASGDFNADGNLDLAIGSTGHDSTSGKIFIFYGGTDVIPKNIYAADATISGEALSYFGYAMTSGDFNYDGATDLAISSVAYNTNTGRTYIFYNDGSIPTTAATADVIITGEATSNYFGTSMTSGDFNYDGRVDLGVGTRGYSSYTGRTYIFYNDGSIPATAATADVIITGEATSNYFGYSIISGDFNNDGKTDLAVGAYGYSNTGRAYIFYNDGTIPTTAATADVIITGEVSSRFGYAMTSGDFNNDTKIDLVVSARDYYENYDYDIGRVYIFYNDGTIPTTAVTADVVITGEDDYGKFGFTMSSGDFNADGKTDLAVSAPEFYIDIGRAYIFYNDGTYPSNASGADVKIDGNSIYYTFGKVMLSGDLNADNKTDLFIANSEFELYVFYNNNSISTEESFVMDDKPTSYFGSTLTSGDFNNDSRLDLAVGAYGDYAGRGKVYLFYNDGSMPTSPDTADISITGESLENFFGYTLSSGDMNNDNQTDIIVGAKGYDTNTGRVYIIYNDGTYPSLAADSDIKIDGENDNDNFGYAIATGDIAGDSEIDLIIGANGYSTNTGRAYIFNNDGTIPTVASSADNVITGENSNDYFGSSLITGDFDYDMDNDLVVGAYGYNNNTGRSYIFNHDASYPILAADSDIKIDGEATNNYFSSAFTKGDFNNDSRLDLVAGAYGYSTNKGRVYIFNNDGTVPVLATNADNMITGEDYNNYFGSSMASADFNADSKIDLGVGAYGFGSNKGNSYIFYGDGSIPALADNADAVIGGNTSGDKLGTAVMGGDFNGNRKDDLCVGYIGSTWQGGFYIYEVDAEGTKPDYVKNRGGGKVRGTVRMR